MLTKMEGTELDINELRIISDEVDLFNKDDFERLQQLDMVENLEREAQRQRRERLELQEKLEKVHLQNMRDRIREMTIEEVDENEEDEDEMEEVKEEEESIDVERTKSKGKKNSKENRKDRKKAEKRKKNRKRKDIKIEKKQKKSLKLRGKKREKRKKLGKEVCNRENIENDSYYIDYDEVEYYKDQESYDWIVTSNEKSSNLNHMLNLDKTKNEIDEGEFNGIFTAIRVLAVDTNEMRNETSIESSNVSFSSESEKKRTERTNFKSYEEYSEEDRVGLAIAMPYLEITEEDTVGVTVSGSPQRELEEKNLTNFTEIDNESFDEGSVKMALAIPHYEYYHECEDGACDRSFQQKLPEKFDNESDGEIYYMETSDTESESECESAESHQYDTIDESDEDIKMAMLDGKIKALGIPILGDDPELNMNRKHRNGDFGKFNRLNDLVNEARRQLHRNLQKDSDDESLFG
ncbi:DgyrCDS13568 [Dimorphilus gyrociliatus]|nr:DgyrCDS13568 [Dimorphilus gyrociliatus]